MKARAALSQVDLDFVLEHTSGFWSAFSGARFFITGGTGFLGLWLLEVIQHANRQLGCNIEVLVLSRSPEQAALRAPHIFDNTAVLLLRGDVSSFSDDIGTIDVCIHAATDVANTSRANDYLNIFSTGVAGTSNMLQLAYRMGARNFLFTSSGAVYGAQPPTMSHIPEAYFGAPDSLDVRTAYGQMKRMSEWLACAHGAVFPLNVSIARIFALVGPGIPLDGPFAAGNFIRDALAGRDIVINGDGRPLRSYMYMADACVWLLSILQNGGSGKAYNVGGERAVSIADLAELVRQCSGSTMSIDVRGKAGDSVLPARYVPDTSLARTTLGLREFTRLDDALLQTIDWYRTAGI